MFEDIFPSNDTPEIRRVSLSSTILRLKVLSRHAIAPSSADSGFMLGVFHDPKSILEDCIEPPQLSSIENAFDELFEAGALESASKVSVDPDLESRGEFSREAFAQATVTSLGYFLSNLPFSFEYARSIALAAVLSPKHIPHLIVIAASLSQQEAFLLPHPRMNDAVKFPQMVVRSTYGRVTMDKGWLSDILSTVNLFKEYIHLHQSLALRRSVQHEKPPSIISSIEGTPFRDPLVEFNFRHGISWERLKMLLNSISEMSLRLISELPQHSELLVSLSTIARLGRNLRSQEIRSMREMQGFATSKISFEHININEMLPMTASDRLVIDFILVLALNRSIVRCNFSVQDPVLPKDRPGWSANETFVLPRTPPELLASEDFLALPEFEVVYKDIKSVYSPPIDMGSPNSKSTLTRPLFLQFYEEKHSNVPEIAIYGEDERSRLVCHSPLSALVFLRLFYHGKLTVRNPCSKWQNGVVGLMATGITSQIELAAPRSMCVVKWTAISRSKQKNCRISVQSIVPSLIGNLRFEFNDEPMPFDEKRDRRRKETDKKKAIQDFKTSLTKNLALYAIASNVVVSPEGSLHADRISFLPFRTHAERCSVTSMLLLGMPGELYVESDKNALALRSDSQQSLVFDDGISATYFDTFRRIRLLLQSCLNHNIAKAQGNQALLECIRLCLMWKLPSEELVKQAENPSMPRQQPSRPEKETFRYASRVLSEQLASNVPASDSSSILEVLRSSEKKRCPICRKQFTSDSSLDAHLEAKHQAPASTHSRFSSSTADVTRPALYLGAAPKNLFKCHSCNRNFASIEAVQNHSAAKHQPGLQPSIAQDPEQPLHCQTCEREFPDMRALYQHQNAKHPHRRTYSCSFCPQTFFSHAAFELHIEDGHSAEMKQEHVSGKNDPSFVCSICQGSFQRRKGLEDHLWMKHGIDENSSS